MGKQRSQRRREAKERWLQKVYIIFLFYTSCLCECVMSIAFDLSHVSTHISPCSLSGAENLEMPPYLPITSSGSINHSRLKWLGAVSWGVLPPAVEYIIINSWKLKLLGIPNTRFLQKACRAPPTTLTLNGRGASASRVLPCVAGKKTWWINGIRRQRINQKARQASSTTLTSHGLVRPLCVVCLALCCCKYIWKYTYII